MKCRASECKLPAAGGHLVYCSRGCAPLAHLTNVSDFKEDPNDVIEQEAEVQADTMKLRGAGLKSYKRKPKPCKRST